MKYEETVYAARIGTYVERFTSDSEVVSVSLALSSMMKAKLYQFRKSLEQMRTIAFALSCLRHNNVATAHSKKFLLQEIILELNSPSKPKKYSISLL